MSSGRFSAAVLTISDTASQDASKDASGPAVVKILQDASYRISSTDIVPDEAQQVRDWVSEQCSNGIHLVVTTGSTGFGTRDIAPEAISPLIARPAPGVVHLMIAASLKATPLAALSRPVAGLSANGTLIVTLPGSPKAVRENLDAILPILSHAIDLARGGTGKVVHQKLAAGDSALPSGHEHHDHHHHHGHAAPKTRTVLSNDMSQGVSSRQRKSPYPIIELEKAYELLFANVPVLPVVTRKVDSSLRGHVLAEDVRAEGDWPRTQTTNVDGYAVRASQKPGVYPVTTLSKLGSSSLPADTICRVNTGGPLPAGADAVIMVEDTIVSASRDGEEVTVELLAQVEAGENVRQPGSDVKQGDVVLEAGSLTSEVGGEIGTLAFVAKKEVKVIRKPVVAILSTGNEIKDLHDADATTATPDSNRPSLHLALTALGYEVIDLGITTDTVESTRDALEQGRVKADIILATGGTSMGEADLLKPVIERELSGTVHFGRVAMKPGKPTTFATVPPAQGKALPVPIFALPGNPASALVTFNLFVRPALRKMEGCKGYGACHLPRIRAKTIDTLRLDPRPEFHRVRLSIDEKGRLVAHSTGGQRSSRTVSLAHANGLVALPSGTGSVAAGSDVDVVLIGALQANFVYKDLEAWQA